jgi:ABC-2 type transport system permease protein
VNKVYFPREIMPLATIGANVVLYLIQTAVLLVALVVFRHPVDLAYVWLLPLALLVALVLTAALSILAAGLNVYARDLQHLLELVVLAWFWLTPIVYPWHLVADELAQRDLPTWLTLLNPMTSIVLTFQRALYGVTSYDDAGGATVLVLPDESVWWYFRNLAVLGIVSTVLLGLALRLFGRLEANFAEEL